MHFTWEKTKINLLNSVTEAQKVSIWTHEMKNQSHLIFPLCLALSVNSVNVQLHHCTSYTRPTSLKEPAESRIFSNASVSDELPSRVSDDNPVRPVLSSDLLRSCCVTLNSHWAEGKPSNHTAAAGCSSDGESEAASSDSGSGE